MSSLHSFLLLAQLRAKQPKPGDWAFGWGTVGTIATVSALLVLVIWLITVLIRYRAQRTCHSPWQLFHGLCAAHGLNHGERSLVRQLARDLELDQPAVLFVEPAWWDHDRLPAGLTRQFTVIDKLRKRLFAPR
jgi:hypothetical protein